ncbi:MAG: cell filamentation protein Fic [Betaproteobacteria bacterium HGW-Betaproteobacteria-18]|nr:MAG: cell filamentation protein Fic [Betaproteobacteria bacterium HGW-Betaproteobacteria-18]
MAAPHEKLAQSLAELAKLQDQGARVIRSSQLSRTHRERLTKSGFLAEVLKGWYLPGRPGESLGNTSAWFAGMRNFISGYCDERFDNDWHLSPEQSLQLRSGERALPLQLQIWTKGGHNQLVPLPHGCSLFLYRAPGLLRSKAEPDEGGLRLVELAPALVAVNAGFYRQQHVAARIAMSLIDDSTELLTVLLNGSHSVVAGRLAGALRALGRAALADNIVQTMKSAGYVVLESSPFDVVPPTLPGGKPESPYVQRLRATWEQMRAVAIENLPAPNALPTDIGVVLRDVEDRYVSDAYHSLSIEGYRVTPELIERVRAGDWDPDGQDRYARDAMAAKGYFEAHTEVTTYIERALKSSSPSHTLPEALSSWHRALFSPSVQAGLLKPSDLAGWRNEQVYIRGAMHVPLPKEAVRDCMPVLFDLIAAEPHAGVRAVLGHFFFVYIHPYVDGNGRLGRFLMNAMLATGGYVWTVVPVEQRKTYMEALEAASTGHDIAGFAAFIGQLIREQTHTAHGP